MGKTSNNHVSNGVSEIATTSTESTTPENQLANLRNILFGSTAKSFEERLEQLEASLDRFQIKQNDQEQAFASERQCIESHFNTQLQSLQAENNQLKDALQKMQTEANEQINALEKSLVTKLETQEASTQDLKQTINHNQNRLGDLLIQLGQQLKQEHDE